MMTADFEQQRIRMVDGQLRATDVNDVPIVDAMAAVPREAFVPPSWKALAYIDDDVEIAPAREGRPARFLMKPSPFGRLLQLAAPRPGDRVLDVGAGTGYSSAVLSRIVASVVALESDPTLAAEASAVLAAQGCGNATVVEGPLASGHGAGAPYDVVVINGSVDTVPQALLDQLAEGGRLVAVIGRGNAGRATLHLREGGLISIRRGFNAALKPLSEFDRVPEFEF